MSYIDLIILLVNPFLTVGTFILVFRFSFLYGIKQYNPLAGIFLFLALICTLFVFAIIDFTQLLKTVLLLSLNAPDINPDFQVPELAIDIDPKSAFLIHTGLLLFVCAALLLMLKLPFKEMKRQQKTGKLSEPLWMKATRMAFKIAVALIAFFLFTNLFFPGKFYAPVSSSRLVGIFFKLIPVGLIAIRAKAIYKRQKDISDFEDKPFDVLFLRSFYLDNLYFARARTKEKEHGDLSFYYNPYPLLFKRKLTFEQFFGFQIKKQIGAFVGIGRPDIRYPKEGIQNLYPKDSEWQVLVRSLIQQAGMIIVQVGNTEYLRQELGIILSTGNIEKLFIFTEPEDLPQKGLLQRIRKWINTYPGNPAYNKRIDRSALKQLLSEVGTGMDFVPPPGAVISFDADKQAILLAEKCRLPSEYIAVVKQHSPQ